MIHFSRAARAARQGARLLPTLALSLVVPLFLIDACTQDATTGPSSSQQAAAGSLPTDARPVLEVVRVDDTLDPFASLDEATIPKGSGISLFTEQASLGPGHTEPRHFARLALHEHETLASGRARFETWLRTITLPQGARFGIQALEEYDGASGTATAGGLRSVVLSGDAVLRTADLTHAEVQSESSEGAGGVSISLTVSPVARGRLETATREWLYRRLAIVIDGDVRSAPVVKSTIAGGRMSVTLGAGDADQRKEQANRLVARLVPR